MAPNIDIPLTWHAQARLRQRGIPLTAVEFLLDYGSTAYDHCGGERFFFDKRARRACQRHLRGAALRQVERHFGVYAVQSSDGALVTVGHRTKRLPRP